MGWFGFTKKSSKLPERFRRPGSDKQIAKKVIRQEQNLKSAEFKKIIRDQLSPELRQMGFVGSGFTYRRVTKEHYIHAIQIFPNPRGGECWMEAGVDIDTIPNAMNELVAPKKVVVLDCDIRINLVLPGDYEMYDYGMTDEEGLETVRLMLEVIRGQGERYFENFREFPGGLAEIEPEDFSGNSEKLDRLGENTFPVILLLARLHLWLGDRPRANAFADLGLSQVDGQRGSGLVPYFEKVKSGVLM